ncbi:FAD-dependent monooxygenase [Streptomyces griseofuscus]|uniref:FAD-dependent monooxygenase n=1 Tax=Streptomyces TaxID=1883 RepID=UPI00081E51FF|nr:MULTISPECIES: FAD-dependent monooxygenase [unclassified Streptomyces]MYQ91658.1 FAD-binding monooxygenase [Streptomyces sp. SID4946]SCF69061.1 2-polyprenyl-6-methoxyphenol hydroxylase [Streptomyces sp. DconLS]SCG05994.1 2-polyprenyl-6-methoxyphenol hydroxylase [Streptomyces sp. LamerLS-31b]
MPRVLVVGAGIAGDTVALMLGRAGWEVTVAEIAPELRGGGQSVDLRGDCRAVLDRLGLLDEVLARLVDQRGAAWVDGDGRRLAEMPVEAFGGNGYVSKEELLRSDLARVLHDAAGAQVTHLFGETVEALEDAPNGVSVRFRHAPPAEFDLVIGADGAHSRVRRLRFGPEEAFRRQLGLAHAWFTMDETPATPPVDGWFITHNAPGSRSVEARPGRPGQQEIGFTFAATALPPRRDREAQFALLDQVFADVGWRTRELLAAARQAPDFALDTFDQIQVPKWSDGRVVLLGDSAWCASPLSGLGTALALRGAAALTDAVEAADALRLPHRLSDALTAYETAMRPRVQNAQRLFPGRVRQAAPRTELGIHTVTWLIRQIQKPPLAKTFTRLAAGHGQGQPA